MHICPDEIIAVTASLPFIGYAVMKVQHAWHWLWHRGEPKDDGCCDNHDHED